MKQIKLSWAGFFIVLFTTAGIFVACQKQADLPDLTSASTDGCCVGSYSETVSTLFSCGNNSSGFLSIVGQNNENSITFTINRTGKLNDNTLNRFTRVEYKIYKEGIEQPIAMGGTEGSDNSPKTTYSFSYNLEEGSVYEGCEKYSIYVVIKGLEGFNALPINCSNEWNGQGQGVFAKTFDYTVKTVCENTPLTCNPRTQTIGYYGSSTTSAGYKYLTNNFSKVTTPLIIGDINCGQYLAFSSAKQVNDFIKKQGTGNILVLPKPSTFSAQVLTLSLNVIFFSGLNNMIVIQEGPFYGMTVSQVLNLANQALAGCPGVLNFSDKNGNSHTLTLSQINSIVDAINNSYVDGKNQNTGVLDCPQ